MRSHTLLFLIAVLCSLPASAQTFDLGGTGEFGPIVVTEDTEIPLPPDGVLQATRVEIAAGATLTFGRNERNTGVILVATEEVIIDGTLSVSGAEGVAGAGGAGGPGGSDGGSPQTWSGTTAYRPVFFGHCGVASTNLNCRPLRGAQGGDGSYYTSSTPTSGCTLGAGGGGGGGVLVIMSHREISGSGSIQALGGQGGLAVPTGGTCTNAGSRRSATGGSNGAVLLVTPRATTADLSIGAGSARIEATFIDEMPAVTPATPSFSSTLTRFIPSTREVNVRFLSVEGVELDEPTDEVSVTVTGSAASFTVEVTGCGNQAGTVNGLRASTTSPTSFAVTNSASFTSSNDRVVVPLNISVGSSGTTTLFRAYAHCNE